MDLGLKGMKAVLAGASKGIGRATAEALAAEGCDIAICARGQEGVDAAIAALKAKGVNAVGSAVDMADAQAYRAWVDAAATELGGCDIFISFASAGGGPASEETWKATFELDVLATFRGVEAAMPHLEKSYNAMKAAVINYASALSQKLAPAGIRVNTVSPGPVFVDGGAWDMIKTHMTALYDGTVQNIPMGRMGSADEVARAIAFVASPTCRFMTGTNLVIDGGLTKRVQY
jgi:3-oxoacyl-[acyl-carrier protein] reductase